MGRCGQGPVSRRVEDSCRGSGLGAPRKSCDHGRFRLVAGTGKAQLTRHEAVRHNVFIRHGHCHILKVDVAVVCPNRSCWDSASGKPTAVGCKPLSRRSRVVDRCWAPKPLSHRTGARPYASVKGQRRNLLGPHVGLSADHSPSTRPAVGPGGWIDIVHLLPRVEPEPTRFAIDRNLSMNLV